MVRPYIYKLTARQKARATELVQQAIAAGHQRIAIADYCYIRNNDITDISAGRYTSTPAVKKVLAMVPKMLKELKK